MARCQNEHPALRLASSTGSLRSVCEMTKEGRLDTEPMSGLVARIHSDKGANLMRNPLKLGTFRTMHQSGYVTWAKRRWKRAQSTDLGKST